MNNISILLGCVSAISILVGVWFLVNSKRKLAVASILFSFAVCTVLAVLTRMEEKKRHRWVITSTTITNGTYEVHGSYYDGNGNWLTILQPAQVSFHQLPMGSRIDSVPISPHSVILATRMKIPGPQDTNFTPIVQISGSKDDRQIRPVTPSTLRGK